MNRRRYLALPIFGTRSNPSAATNPSASRQESLGAAGEHSPAAARETEAQKLDEEEEEDAVEEDSAAVVDEEEAVWTHSRSDSMSMTRF